MLVAFLKRLIGIEANEWQEVLRDNDRQTNRELKPIVTNFFVPDSIDVQRWSANYYLTTHYHSADAWLSDVEFCSDDDQERELSKHLTKTMKRLDLLGGVPLGFPKWFIAAYPDVVAWAAKSDASDPNLLHEVFGVEDANDVDESSLVEYGKFKQLYLRKLIDYYIREIKPVLECVKAK